MRFPSASQTLRAALALLLAGLLVNAACAGALHAADLAAHAGGDVCQLCALSGEDADLLQPAVGAAGASVDRGPPAPPGDRAAGPRRSKRHPARAPPA